MIDKDGGKYIPACDGCDTTLPPCDTFDEAKDAMLAEDWSRKNLGQGIWINLCKTCQETV